MAQTRKETCPTCEGMSSLPMERGKTQYPSRYGCPTCHATGFVRRASADMPRTLEHLRESHLAPFLADAELTVLLRDGWTMGIDVRGHAEPHVFLAHGPFSWDVATPREAVAKLRHEAQAR